MRRGGTAARAARARLRPVGPEDVAVLTEHRLRMWEDIGGFGRLALAQHAPIYRRWLRRALRAGRVTGYLALTPAGEPAASGLVWFEEAQPRPGEPAPRSPYILSMYTAPGHRGAGLASAIVRKILEDCRARGFSRVTLHASPQGRAVYRRLGFERTWEMRRYLDGRSGPARRASRRRRSAR